VAAIQSAGGQVHSYVADIAKKMPVQSLIQDVLNDLGRLDILVNCAEVEPRQAALDMDEWDWQRTLDVNLTGAFLLTQVAGRVMRELGAGVIIHVGERAHAPELRSAYFASKAGLEAFVERARPELERHGVRIHYAAPRQDENILEQILKLCFPSF
jgi:NAD(P)-dependent dehydrogenase (short-subunit alcohol dehydrogenase family)